MGVPSLPSLEDMMGGMGADRWRDGPGSRDGGSALFEDLTVLLSVLLLSCKKEFWIESETSSGLALVG
jgi:hypothetical protein